MSETQALNAQFASPEEYVASYKRNREIANVVGKGLERLTRLKLQIHARCLTLQSDHQDEALLKAASEACVLIEEMLAFLDIMSEMAPSGRSTDDFIKEELQKELDLYKGIIDPNGIGHAMIKIQGKLASIFG